MISWTSQKFHRSLFMGESVLVILSCPLFHLLNLHLLRALQLILRPLYHSLPPSHTPSFASPSSPTPPPLPTAAPSCPQRLRCPRDEWLPEQWTVSDRYKQPREPTPVVVSSDDDSDDCLDLIQARAATAPEPTSYSQSQHRSDSELWQKACEEEMEAHRVNGTWKVVKLPPGKRAIGSRWFLKVKYNADGSLDRYKARLVAKGYSQRPGFDFKETFAPTVRYSTIRIILALAALEDLELHSVDISHAYLNAPWRKRST
jgi:hypothetical protein